jgi:hypothetical protein
MTTDSFRTIIEIPEFTDSNLIDHCSHYAITGLETEHPILQIDHMLFEGSFVETLGTNMIFSQKLDENGDPVKLEHESNITKKLVFRAISVTPKRKV